MDKLFTFENADEIRSKLVEGLNFPYVSCCISTLGGKDNISLLLTISKQDRKDWYNGILENSQYAHIHISQYGKVEQFRGSKLKLRSFTNISLNNVIKKINNIKSI